MEPRLYHITETAHRCLLQFMSEFTGQTNNYPRNRQIDESYSITRRIQNRTALQFPHSSANSLIHELHDWQRQHNYIQ